MWYISRDAQNMTQHMNRYYSDQYDGHAEFAPYTGAILSGYVVEEFTP